MRVFGWLAPWLAAALVVTTLAVWTHGFCAFTNFSVAQVKAGPLPRLAPPLPARDAQGRRWDYGAPGAGYRLIQPMYLRCPDACPIAMSQLAKVAAVLKDSLGDRLQIVSLSVDRDPVDALERMWRGHGAHENWLMASLDVEDIEGRMGELGTWVYRRPDGLINHGVEAYLISPRGEVLRVYSADDDPREIAAEIRRQVEE